MEIGKPNLSVLFDLNQKSQKILNVSSQKKSQPNYRNSTTDSPELSGIRGAFRKLLEKNLTEEESLRKSLLSLNSNVNELHRKISRLDEKIKNVRNELKE